MSRANAILVKYQEPKIVVKNMCLRSMLLLNVVITYITLVVLQYAKNGIS